MDPSLIIKVIIFVILALLACWPYFENLKRYPWFKKILIGIPITLLLLLGIMDIIDSEAQSRKDKKEISKLTDTICTMSSRVVKLSNKVVSLSDKLDEIEDDLDGKQDSVIDELNAEILNNKQTLLLQRANGNLNALYKDTVKNN